MDATEAVDTSYFERDDGLMDNALHDTNTRLIERGARKHQRSRGRRKSKREDEEENYDTYRKKLEQLEMRKSELEQALRFAGRSEGNEEDQSELEQVQAEEKRVGEMVQRLKPAYMKLMDKEPARVHFHFKRVASQIGVGAITEALKREKKLAKMRAEQVQVEEEQVVGRSETRETQEGQGEGEEEEKKKRETDLASGFMAELEKMYGS